MASKVSANSFSSSCGPPRLIRSCNVCSERRRAASVIRCTGRSTRPATHQPSPIEAMVMKPSASPDSTSRLLRVWAWLTATVCLSRCSKAVSGCGRAVTVPDADPL